MLYCFECGLKLGSLILACRFYYSTVVIQNSVRTAFKAAAMIRVLYVGTDDLADRIANSASTAEPIEVLTVSTCQQAKHPMCNFLAGDKVVQVERWTTKQQIDEDTYGVSKHLANQAILIMPEVMRTDRMEMEPFRQV